MLVSEMFLLMLHNWRKGRIHYGAYSYKNLGLAGAMILDLGIKGKISLYGKKSRIVDYHACGDPFIDKILVFLYKSKRSLKLRRWLVKISRFYKKSSIYFYQRLENHGILSSGFRTKKYYFKRPEVKQSLLEQIKHVIFDNMNPDIELLCLLSLIKACDLINVYFVRKYRKYVRRKIDGLIHSNSYDSEILELIKNIIKVIEKIIAARSL